MKKQRYEQSEALERLIHPDGFSPDLPEGLHDSGDLKGLSWKLRLLVYMLSGMRKGSLEVRLPNGAVRVFQGQQAGPHAVWRIKSDRLIGHVLRAGEVGVGEAYLDDCWDSPDLTRLLIVLYLAGVGLTWIAFHAGLLLIVARAIKAPTFYLAVGSQANIGGAASAPVVASAFHPSLAPVGVLLAVLGYALGTYGAWLCGQMLRMAGS